MPEFASILKDVERITAEVFALEPDEVTPEARLVEDLGAESIDFLDLSFRCQKHFGVDTELQKLASSDEFPINDNGRFTKQAVTNFKSRYPFLNYDEVDEDPTPDQIVSLFTVEKIARLVETSLAKQCG